jgi:hypothetical protein
MEPTDPPRKHYGLKPREFDRLNAAGKAPEKSTEHDVFAMLQQNRAVEKQLGKDEIEIKEIKSRRKRDYWLILIGGNLLIIGMVAVTRFNPISLMYGFSGIVILTLSLTWVMWFVMDDY